MAEKKDVWGELWSREIPESELDRLVNTDWLYEVKAEGDALQEKIDELKDWERIAREQADTLLLQRANIEKLKEKADIFDAWEEGRCGYFKPGYGCDSPTGIGNSVMCRKIPNCEVLAEEGFWKQVKAARDKLYADLPTGDVDAFALIKVVQSHIAKLDEILGDS